MPSDAAHTIKYKQKLPAKPLCWGDSVSNCRSQACMSLLAITAKRFAVSRGCFHTGDSPFAVSHLAGGTAAERDQNLVGQWFHLTPCEMQHELQKEKQRRAGIEIEMVLMVLTPHMARTYAEMNLLLFA